MKNNSVEMSIVTFSSADTEKGHLTWHFLITFTGKQYYPQIHRYVNSPVHLKKQNQIPSESSFENNWLFFQLIPNPSQGYKN